MIKYKYSNYYTVIIYVVIDMLGLVLSFIFGWLLYNLTIRDINFIRVMRYLPYLLNFIIISWFLKLYTHVFVDIIKESKTLVFSVSFLFSTFTTISYLQKDPGHLSRLVFLFSWLAAIIFVPAFRIILRKYISKFDWWGSRAMIIGAGKTGLRVFKYLEDHPEVGLKPVIVLDDDGEKKKLFPRGVTFQQGILNGGKYTRNNYIRYGIFAIPSLEQSKRIKVIDQYVDNFIHFLIMPGMVGMSTLWVTSLDLGGHLGLEVRHKLLIRRYKILKRTSELCLILLSSILVLPVMMILALIIKLDSKGPVLYRHRRIGRKGSPFYVLKFRSMVQDADKKLQRYLTENPEYKSEWEKDHKIRNDPRITRIGRILRRFSLDELPQFYNVIKNEMSIVGPRPIVDEEIPKYGDSFNLYTKVKPGMTGLWQISGRNDKSYDERVNLDCYYVRNWSLSLDIYIIIKTSYVVLKRIGAY